MMDENIEKFTEKLNELVELAKKEKNVLMQEEINTYFKDMELTPEKVDKICDYLEKNGVDVLRMTEEADVSDDLILDMKNEEEEEELENIDLSVPDGISIEDPVRMYLKEIGKVPLLTAEEEVRLAQMMEVGNIACEILEMNDKGINDKIKSYDALKEEIENRREELKENNEEPSRGDKIIESVFDYAKKISETSLDEEDIKRIRELSDEGDIARKRLAEANLRLVVSIAKRYVGRGMLFLDLIQEGNLGLIKAVEKFDYTKGYKFSTYATWWIRQAITRAIADQARTIRIPVHMVETINKLIRVQRQLLQELGREPYPEEIAEEMKLPVERVREIQKISQEPVSLETPIGEEEDSHLGDFIQDENVPVPAEAAAFTLLKEQLAEVLDTLTEREQKVLRLRFGLDDGRARTLEEVGDEFDVTRERIRQIEAKALRKLRHPSRSRKLKDYLD